MDEMQILSLAREALRQGNKQAAQRLLVQVVQQNPGSEAGWLLLSAAVDDPAKEQDCVKRVLAINPGNDIARRHLAQLTQAQAGQAAPAQPAPEPMPQTPRQQIPVRPIPSQAKNPKKNRDIALLVMAVVVTVIVICAVGSCGPVYQAFMRGFRGESNAPGEVPTEAATDIPTAPPPPLKITGRGDNVLRVGQYSGYATVRFTHDGTSNFTIWSYDASGKRLDLLVNEIGPYSGTVMWDRQAARLQIKADGNWTAEFSK